MEVTLEELRLKVNAEIPELEVELRNLFEEVDVTEEGKLPYDIVETMLRHYFTRSGLVDCLYAVLNQEGKMDIALVSRYLSSSGLGELAKNCNRSLTCDEMALLAIVWLKVLSDVAKNGFVKKGCTENLICGDICADEEDSQVDLFVHKLLANRPQEVSEDNQDQLWPDEFNKPLVDIDGVNNFQGIKCYTYPASITPDGACASAGSVMPHRRTRMRRTRKQKPLMGCC